MDDSWRDSYDAWKLASPYDDYDDDPREDCDHDEYEVDAALRKALERAIEHINSPVPHHQSTSAYRAMVISELRDALALPAAPETDEAASPWRDIATAPKDGTKIWCFTPGGYQVVLTWYADAWRNGQDWNRATWEPTHWQPLPSPPSNETR